MVNCLYEETAIQSKVIDQYKTLLKSYTLPIKNRNHSVYWCNLGHFNCKILHARFNLVRMTVNPVYHRVSRKPESQQMKNEIVAVKRMSKKVDLLQAKYGFTLS